MTPCGARLPEGTRGKESSSIEPRMAAIMWNWPSSVPSGRGDGRISHYLAIKQDITEAKRIADELARHQEHLEEMVQQRTDEMTAIFRALPDLYFRIGRARHHIGLPRQRAVVALRSNPRRSCKSACEEVSAAIGR